MKLKAKSLQLLGKLPPLETRGDVEKFFKQSTIVLAEFITGVLASDLTTYKLSAGKIIQATVKGRLLNQLGDELKGYREKGKIKEDYFATNKSQATLLELLQFIDSGVPDEEVLKALKSIFLNMVAIGATDKEEQVGYQLFQLCKKLNSMDILILRTCYRIYTGEDTVNVNTGSTSFDDWVRTISEKIGYDLPELIGAQDDRLVEMGLLSHRGYTDKSGIRAGKEFRLTKLSIKLCEYISGWEVK